MEPYVYRDHKTLVEFYFGVSDFETGLCSSKFRIKSDMNGSEPMRCPTENFNVLEMADL